MLRRNHRVVNVFTDDPVQFVVRDNKEFPFSVLHPVTGACQGCADILRRSCKSVLT